MSEEMKTLEAQMQQRFTSQIHKATTSTPGFDDLARGGPHESLRAYIKRFSKAISEISGLDDDTAREALKKGLRHRSLFKNEICARYPPTIQDALHRAKGFIELEEENERVERDLARTREELSKARDEREKNFRCERPRQPRQTENRVERSSRQKGRETYGLAGEAKERRVVHGETVTAVKSHRRRAMQPIAAILPDDPVEHSITFHNSEATNLSRPHDDALILTLNVSNCEVGRILVVNGSSADVLFLSTLREMELSESDIERSTTILTADKSSQT
ncbi:hypothetical protein TIFTF001_042883 [Ficus carica]|uniref:Retrotransposon gag domain-containing protein n=1 Tax=Ficus carica TaxID=3494 RepID=A0AA87YV78_FICCA|nr:hypothetical protein TIFTF001_042883 [Ficus carica]